MRLAALSCVSQGENRKDIIKFFGISLKTLSNWIRLDREAKDLNPNMRQSYIKSRIIRDQLSSLVELNPDYTLDEFSDKLNYPRTTIFYHLKKLNITRKKNYTISGTKRAKETGVPHGN